MSSSAPPSSPGARDSSPPPFDSSSSPRRVAALRNDELDPMLEDEEDEGEELIGDDMERDYRAIPRLDVYDQEQLADDDDASELSPGARAAAERAMRKRERADARGRSEGRRPRALMGDDDDDSDGELQVEAAHRRRRRRLAEQGDDDMDGAEDEPFDENAPIIANLEDRKGHSLREWVLMVSPRMEIYRLFKIFLQTHVDEHGNNVHAQKIATMCQNNGESLVVDFVALSNSSAVLAIYVADAPTEMLQIFDECAKQVVLERFPAYDNIRPRIHVRLSGVPVSDDLRAMRQSHLNVLIKVSGVVTRRTSVYPQLLVAKYKCDKCHSVTAPVVFNSLEEKGPQGACPDCQSAGPFSLISEDTIYRNYQRITIQEPPGSVPAGRLPRQKEVILQDDLVDSVKPGDEIEVTGVYRNNFDHSLNTKHGFPVFATVIESNYIEKRADRLSRIALMDEDAEAIRSLAQRDNIGELICEAIAPSIYGHDDIKMALALAMFGGVPKSFKGSPIRGDINVLILGDPGTAKSQFLKFAEKTAPRAVFTTGQGASAVGLTASVQKDPVTREWTLQGGALVLADQGVCLIDEFDKMTDQDRTSIHEAMEQQTISVSKAGIVASLQARCAVIAAANPIRGKYQSGLTFAQNVDLTEPILSRFDILCVVKDVVDPVKDERLASFVVGSHMRSHEDYEAPEDEAGEEDQGDKRYKISQEMLRKYIVYAKRNCNPKLNSIDTDKLGTLYSELRKQSELTGSVPITPRYMDALMRLSEAHARMHLRDHVREDDVDIAIRVVVTSFVESQKFSVMKAMAKRFEKYMTYKKDQHALLLFVLQQMVNQELQFRASTGATVDETVEIGEAEFRSKAASLEIQNLDPFYESDLFKEAGFQFDAALRQISREL